MRKFIVGIFALFFLFPFSLLGADGFNITESFKEATSSQFAFGGDPLAYLTSGIDDPSGDGWLRLTKDKTYQKGYAIVNESFPSGLGVLVDLEFKTWRSTVDLLGGADGFSIFLFDASVDTFNIGAFGGSLGYAQYSADGKSYPGLSRGYFGLGIDEFGNYSNPTEGRIGGIGFKPNCVGLRGPVSTNYAWVTGNSAPGFSLQYGQTTSRPSDTEYYRRFQIIISPDNSTSVTKYTVTLKAATATNGSFQTVFGPYELPSVPPAQLKLGFAASTGDGINFHEVRNLYITTIGGIRVTKNVDKVTAKVGDELTYTVGLFNQGTDTISGLRFDDPVSQFPSGFQVDSVTFDNNGDSLNTATGYSQTNLSGVSVALGPASYANFVIKGKINSYPTGGKISNTAIFKPGTSGITDLDETNDTATVTTTVIDPKIALVKQATETKFTKTGDLINYKFTVVNLGDAVLSDVKITDALLADSATYTSGDTNGNGKLDVGESWVYSGYHVVTSAEEDSGFVSNTAIVTAIDPLEEQIKDISGITVSDDEPTIVKKIVNEFFIPNVFTPNGDGINDYFEIVGLDAYSGAKLRVFNRWGNEVYYNAKYNNNWNGDGLNGGTYYYMLELEKGGKTSSYKGWVLVKK